jgi:hypothetical protein
MPHLAKYDHFLTKIEQSTTSLPPPSLKRNEDTTVYERWAPAFTHETITHNLHEVREEYIHKEIHEYHINHRIQPVIEYEILPPRHFVLGDEGFREIDQKDIPPGTPNVDWYAAEVASNLESMVHDQRTSDEGQSLTSGDVLAIPGSNAREPANHRYPVSLHPRY